MNVKCKDAAPFVAPLAIQNIDEARRLMRGIGVDSYGIKIMSPKTLSYSFKIEGINSFSANIIKQCLLSLGSDAAINREALLRKMKTSIIIFGSLYQMRELVKKLKIQPFELKEVALKIKNALEAGSKKLVFKAKDKILRINRPLICGIINVTPDSFSGDGILKTVPGEDRNISIEEMAIAKAEGMIKSGADIIDIGAESTRPYASKISEEEEIKRLVPVLKVVRKKFPRLIVSVDTYKYRVAREAVDWGADIINDITALHHSPEITDLIRKYKLGCVLMHMKGTPRTMQVNPSYKKGVVKEITNFLQNRVEYCLDNGITKDRIMIDPGIGFGKTTADNCKIIKNLYALKTLGLPIFLGVSRKSFIGKILNTEVNERLVGTISTLVVSYINGANVLRVHNVKEAYQALKMAQAIINNVSYS